MYVWKAIAQFKKPTATMPTTYAPLYGRTIDQPRSNYGRVQGRGSPLNRARETCPDRWKNGEPRYATIRQRRRAWD